MDPPRGRGRRKRRQQQQQLTFAFERFPCWLPTDRIVSGASCAVARGGFDRGADSGALLVRGPNMWAPFVCPVKGTGSVSVAGESGGRGGGRLKGRAQGGGEVRGRFSCCVGPGCFGAGGGKKKRGRSEGERTWGLPPWRRRGESVPFSAGPAAAGVRASPGRRLTPPRCCSLSSAERHRRRRWPGAAGASLFPAAGAFPCRLREPVAVCASACPAPRGA